MFITGVLAILLFIILAIGLTLGYVLLTLAAGQEGWKSKLGAVFAWVIIVYSLIISIMICTQWVKYQQTGRMPVDFQCPMRQMME